MAIAYCPSVTAESCHEMANSSASPCDPLICCEHGIHPSPSGKSGRKIPPPHPARQRDLDLDGAVRRRAFSSSQAHTGGHSSRERGRPQLWNYTRDTEHIRSGLWQTIICKQEVHRHTSWLAGNLNKPSCNPAAGEIVFLGAHIFQMHSKHISHIYHIVCVFKNLLFFNMLSSS